MQLIIDSTMRDFVPIKAFRQAHQLPETFGVATFEPKDYTGLAQIDTAGNDMKDVRDAVLKAIPAHLTLPDLLEFVHTLTQLFRTQIYAINDHVNLKDVEIDFAVAGFSDVCQAYLYDRIRAHSGKTTPQSFSAFYGTWLNDSVRVSQQTHIYTHENAVWSVYVINHAYGRVGLRVHINETTHYIADSTLACPAEGYMFTLLKEVCNTLDEALAES